MASLQGLKVVDFSQMMTGPFATQMLRDFGAEVVKVEPPEGDPFIRSGESTVGGLGVFYVSINRGKDVLRRDLKQEAAREEILALLKDADVVIENFRAGVTRKLGIDYDTICRANPRIIYCSIGGFEDEANRMRPALDQIVQAESGLMQLTGTRETGPLKTGFPLTDLLAGLYATIGVLNALYHRERTGQGQFVSLSMMGCAVHSLVPRDVYYSVTRQMPPLSGNEHWDIVPNNVYRASDGKGIMIITINDKFWRVLVEALGAPELAEDSRYATKSARLAHRAQVDAALQLIFSRRPAAEWEHILRPAGAIFGVVRTWDEVIGQGGLMRHLVCEGEVDAGGRFEFIRNPIRFFSGAPEVPAQVQNHDARR